MMTHTASEAEKKAHSTDSSIFAVLPENVIYPTSVEDVKSFVKKASEEHIVLSVRAGGTCMSGASLSSGTILNLTKHMNTIHVNPYTKSAHVEMGAYYRDIEVETKKHNLIFAPYPSSKDICGIGGMIGNNASGEKSIRHGGTIDNVLSVDVVLHDGEMYTFEEISDEECIALSEKPTVLGSIYKQVRSLYIAHAATYAQAVGRVKKAASGYRLEKIFNKEKNTWNLAKLFVGAQATLGIITSARLSLIDEPVYTRAVFVPIDNIAHLPQILQILMEHNPEGVETFDVHTFMYAKKFLPEDTAHIAPYFSKGEKLFVLAQFSEKDQHQTDQKAHQAVDALKTASHDIRAEYISDISLITHAWNIRRSSFRVLRDAVYDIPTKRAVPCIEDIIVPIDQYNVFVPKLLSILETHAIEYGFHGHIGDGALRVIPIIDFVDKERAVQTIKTLCHEVFALIKELGGNTSADHGDGIIRTPFLKEFYGEGLYNTVIVGLKDIFDPKRIFNADKKIGITEKDLLGMVK